jgi:hypothetical protein
VPVRASEVPETETAGCRPSALTLDEPPYEPVVGHGRADLDRPLGSGREVVDTIDEAQIDSYEPLEPPSEIGGRSLQFLAVVKGIDMLSMVYASSKVTPGMTRSELWQRNGIAINQVPAEAEDPAKVALTIPDVSWEVEIGPHLAALVHGDADASGVRAFNLVWTDGARKWTMYGNPVSPNEMVDLARSIYCADQGQ